MLVEWKVVQLVVGKVGKTVSMVVQMVETRVYLGMRMAVE